MRPTLSIVIPVLNEEVALPVILNDIKECEQDVPFSIECIVVDGGSEDKSVEICKKYQVAVYQAKRGRGPQLRTGAQKSAGEVLLFLHADSRLTAQHCLKAVLTVQNDDVIAGGFKLKFNDDHFLMKFVEWLNLIRLHCTKVFYGDHGIFLQRDKYEAVGGFLSLPIFEDINFSRRLKRLGKVVITSPPLVTSSRRFRAGGIIRTVIKMTLIYMLYWLKMPPEKIVRLYQKISPVGKLWSKT